jgi:translation initiation factor 1
MHKPFANLARLRGAMPETDPSALQPTAPPDSPAPAPPASIAAGTTVPRAVVRLERSGRGGKEVTIIDKLDLSEREREAWLKALKSALGCGGVVEGTTIVLQGDHRKRLPAMLLARGVKKVIAG